MPSMRAISGVSFASGTTDAGSFSSTRPRRAISDCIHARSAASASRSAGDAPARSVCAIGANER